MTHIQAHLNRMRNKQQSSVENQCCLGELKKQNDSLKPNCVHSAYLEQTSKTGGLAPVPNAVTNLRLRKASGKGRTPQ